MLVRAHAGAEKGHYQRRLGLHLVGNLSLVKRIQVSSQLLRISNSITAHTVICPKSVDKFSDDRTDRNKDRKNEKLGREVL